MEIRINNVPLDLPRDFSIDVDDFSPIFNKEGSQSMPATLPATGHNNKILGWPGRADTATDPNAPALHAVVGAGAYRRSGVVNVVSAGEADGITVNIGFDNATAYNAWRNRRLKDLRDLPVLTGESVGLQNTLDDMLGYLAGLYQGAAAATDPLAVFPMAVGRESVGAEGDKSETTIWEMLNVPDSNGGMRQPSTVKRVLNGELTAVSVPEGYGVSPCLRVWEVLRVIFADLGLTVLNNINTDPELARLVVLNNVADAVCTGVIRWVDLMPDCTVDEFLTALHVRFGLVYNIDFDEGTATLAFLKDIVRDASGTDLTERAGAPPLISYEAHTYVKLTAGTSLEEAAPPMERLEDFVGGEDLAGLHRGAGVGSWTYIPDAGGDSGGWDGDVRDDFFEPDIPEPGGDEGDDRDDWDDRDDRDDQDDRVDWVDRDDRDDGPYSIRKKKAAPESSLACEFVTGRWFRIDETNHEVKASGSGFFSWDPQPEGLEAYELASTDECVPVLRVNTAGTGRAFNDYCPVFLAGARHCHSYILGSDGEKDGSTPLAFALAYTTGGKTVGRLGPQTDEGKRMVMDDGSVPELTLFFQFSDGLFARYWAEFDEVLRHGGRVLEFQATLPALPVGGLDFLRPVSFRGIRALVDTVSYTLPAGRQLYADLKLRVLTPVGEYDIKEEQGVPGIAMGGT